MELEGFVDFQSANSINGIHDQMRGILKKGFKYYLFHMLEIIDEGSRNDSFYAFPNEFNGIQVRRIWWKEYQLNIAFFCT
jgi:hypothetical protein